MMACDYMLREDFYELYLMNRLNPDEKAAFENHLKSCSDCRQKLEAERELIGGIRNEAKREMKLEIQRQAEIYREQKHNTDWTLVVKVAAVVFFLVIMPGMLYLINSEYRTKQVQEIDPVITVPAKISDNESSIKELKQDKIESRQREAERRKEIREKTQPIVTAKENKERQARSAPVIEKSSLDYAYDKDEAAAEPTVSEEEKGKIEGIETEPTLSEQEKMPAVLGTVPQRDKLATVRSAGGQGVAVSGMMPAVKSQVFRLDNSLAVSTDEAVLSTQKKRATEPSEYQLLFSSGDTTIQVMVPAQSIGKLSSTGFVWPDTFSVNMQRISNNNIVMDWKLDANLNTYNEGDIKINLVSDKSMQIDFGKAARYNVNLEADKLKAILESTK
jgi:hypothetical protein